MSLLVPSVVESTPRGERSFDLFSRLLANRIVFVGHPLGTDVANLVCAQLLHLAAEAADQPISIYLNSPGGEVGAMTAVVDTMRHLANPIETVCFGEVHAVGAVVVAAGTQGRRLALPNARFVLHQPAGQGRGQIADLLLTAAEIERQRELMADLLAERTGRDPEQVRADTDRHLALSAVEAVEYGLVDQLVEPADVST